MIKSFQYCRRVIYDMEDVYGISLNERIGYKQLGPQGKLMVVVIFSPGLIFMFYFFPSKEHLSFLSYKKKMFLTLRIKDEKKYYVSTIF